MISSEHNAIHGVQEWFKQSFIPGPLLHCSEHEGCQTWDLDIMMHEALRGVVSSAKGVHWGSSRGFSAGSSGWICSVG